MRRRSGSQGNNKKQGKAARLFGAGVLCAVLAFGVALWAQASRAAPAGCSLKGLAPASALVFPLGNASWRVSDSYGWREDPFTGEEQFHRGIDLACAEGTPVLAAMDGVVCTARRSTSYGNYLRIRHAGGQETLYAHMQYLYVRVGEVVHAGQIIGTAGQTGRATGSHLHFELFGQGIRYDPSAALGLS